MARAPARSAAVRPAPLTSGTRFVIVYGKDRFLHEEHLNTLRAAMLKAHGEGGFDTVRFDGQQGPKILADVMDECRSMGLMQQHKIVLVDNAELLFKGEEDDEAAASKPKSAGKKSGPAAGVSGGVLAPRTVLAHYAEEPSPNATLVLRANSWKPSNLEKAVAAMPDDTGAVIKCEPMGEAEMVSWAMKRCKERHESSINAESAAALVRATGVDLGRIDSELEKLALAAGGDGSPITLELVERMVGCTRQEEFFAVQASLLSCEAPRALEHLRDLIEVSRHDPVPIAWAFIETMRKIHVAGRAVAAGRDVSRMEYQLKVFGPGKEQVMQQLARLSQVIRPRRAAALMNRAIKMDAGNKSGLGDPVRNLEVLAMSLANAGQGSLPAARGTGQRR